MCFATRCILARGYGCVKSSFASAPNGVRRGTSRRRAVGYCRGRRAAGQPETHGGGGIGALPPNRRRPGADLGPLAGFLSVRDLEVIAIDDGTFDHRQVGRVVLEL